METKTLKLLQECEKSFDIIRINSKLNHPFTVETVSLGMMNKLNEVIAKELSEKMHQLGMRNYALIVRGVKTCGTFDPNEIFCIFEEQLYVHEADQIWNFLEWLNKENKGFGSGNYEKLFTEFLNR